MHRQCRDARARQRGNAGRLGVVDRELTGALRTRRLSRRLHEAELHRMAVRLDAERHRRQRVFVEIVRGFDPMRLKKSGGRDQHALAVTDQLADVARIGQRRRGDDRHIHVIFEQVRHARQKLHLHRDARKALAILQNGMRQLRKAEVGHAVNPQRAARAGVRVARLGFGVLQVGENLLALPVVALARFRQRNLAR
ncbi:conserved hypothetical protein, partial [Ricinus communis]